MKKPVLRLEGEVPGRASFDSQAFPSQTEVTNNAESGFVSVLFI